jgi:protein O-GlcNAc transferase
MGGVPTNFDEGLLSRNDFTGAEEKLRKVVQSNGSHVAAVNLLTIALIGLGRFADAEQLNPDSDVSWYNYGLISKKLGKPQQAYEQFTKSLKLNPNVPDTWNHRGAVCNDLENYEAALSDFDRAISLSPAFAEAYANKGKSLQLLERYDEASVAYQKALAIEPALSEAWLGLGNVCWALRDPTHALIAYERALSVKADLAQAWVGRGRVLGLLRRNKEALANFDKALSLNPDLAEAWLGWAALTAKRYSDGFAALDKAFSLDPDLPFIKGGHLHAKMHCCDRSGYEAERDQLVASIRAGRKAAFPFDLLPIDCSAEDLLTCAKNFTTDRYPLAPSCAPLNLQRSDKIRIAYLSSDFRGHATSHLMAGLFEEHDHSRFDVLGLSTGASDHTPLRKRLEQSFTSFIDLSALPDDEIASEIAKLDIDILIDLNGLTDGARPDALRHRPASIQVNYLGFPGTMGAPFIDYIIGDGTVIPEDHEQFYSEKVVRLPHSYQANDRKREIQCTPQLSRGDVGLPGNAFVFCCFNSSFKIAPGIFNTWMSLLRLNAGSVLWLLDDSEVARKNLQNEAEQRGVDPARIVFANRVPPAEYLARYRLADLFLDTLPYNGHTTASDALWAGLPVLTQIGHTFAGRVAASLLNAIGLPELVTHSREEYETLALELAHNPEQLRSIKAKLESNRLTTPLFDTTLFARHIEAAYEEMLRRHRAGLPPKAISVEP